MRALSNKQKNMSSDPGLVEADTVLHVPVTLAVGDGGRRTTGLLATSLDLDSERPLSRNVVADER